MHHLLGWHQKIYTGSKPRRMKENRIKPNPRNLISVPRQKGYETVLSSIEERLPTVMFNISPKKKKKKSPGHCGADQTGENMIAFAK